MNSIVKKSHPLQTPFTSDPSLTSYHPRENKKICAGRAYITILWLHFVSLSLPSSKTFPKMHHLFLACTQGVLIGVSALMGAYSLLLSFRHLVMSTWVGVQRNPTKTIVLMQQCLVATYDILISLIQQNSSSQTVLSDAASLPGQMSSNTHLSTPPVPNTLIRTDSKWTFSTLFITQK